MVGDEDIPLREGVKYSIIAFLVLCWLWCVQQP